MATSNETNGASPKSGNINWDQVQKKWHLSKGKPENVNTDSFYPRLPKENPPTNQMPVDKLPKENPPSNQLPVDNGNTSNHNNQENQTILSGTTKTQKGTKRPVSSPEKGETDPKRTGVEVDHIPLMEDLESTVTDYGQLTNDPEY